MRYLFAVLMLWLLGACASNHNDRLALSQNACSQAGVQIESPEFSKCVLFSERLAATVQEDIQAKRAEAAANLLLQYRRELGQ